MSRPPSRTRPFSSLIILALAFCPGSRLIEKLALSAVEAPPAGEYSVVIAGASVAVGPQPYALVITGDFEPIGPVGIGTAPTRNRANAQMDSGSSKVLRIRESSALMLILVALWTALLLVDCNS
jgi:hypothetical protein